VPSTTCENWLVSVRGECSGDLRGELCVVVVETALRIEMLFLRNYLTWSGRRYSDNL
jgi:hypothetical protein